MPDPALLLSSNTPSNFPELLKNTPAWIHWKPTWSEERQKYLKLPVLPGWQKRGTLFNQLPPVNPPTSYGFVYSISHNFICIDVDNGSEENAQLVELLDSYTEWSPSGNGAHVIVSTDDKLSLVTVFGTTSHNNVDKRDLYISSGYVTITGRLIAPYATKTIKQLSGLALTTILTPYFKPVQRSPKLSVVPDIPKPEITPEWTPERRAEPRAEPEKWIPNLGQIQAILTALPVKYLTPESFKTFNVLDLDNPNPPESREAWLVVGQALHDLNNGDLMHCDLWRDWSEQGNKYDQQALYACWRSFSSSNTTNPITFATLQKLANAQRPQYVNFSGNPPKPMSTLDNIKIYIEYSGIKLRYNTVFNSMEVICPTKLCRILGHDPSLPLDIDLAISLIESEMLKQGFKDNSIFRKIKSYFLGRMTTNIYNPIVEYFAGTPEGSGSLKHNPGLPPWDQRSRIPDLMATIDCTPDAYPVYAQYIKAWLIQVMAAVFTTKEKPNRLNNVLILQGDQGVGKTMWVESLFPPALRQYCVGSKSVNMSQFRNDMVKLTMELTNTLICNINEIDTVFKAKTYSEFKAFLDSTTDKVVLPYGRGTTDIIRSTVFIGSTNRTQLFTDTTGNRRFMLISAKSFNFKHNIDLDQLWAEAYYYYKQGHRWYFTDNDEDVKTKQTYDNMQALNVTDETILDLLNNTFDPTQRTASVPLSHDPLWTMYTFPRIRTILGLKLTPNSHEFRTAKQTVKQWLTAVCFPAKPVIKEPHHQGAAWQCLMPPLKIF